MSEVMCPTCGNTVDCEAAQREREEEWDQAQSSTIKAGKYSLLLDEVVALCESDPLFEAMLRPQLEKIGELFNARADAAA